MHMAMEYQNDEGGLSTVRTFRGDDVGISELGSSASEPALCSEQETCKTATQRPSNTGRARLSDYRFNLVDACVVIASLIALLFAVLTITPAIPWAARLQYTNQIIIVGFLLGIMSLAFNRVVPYTCMAVERRFGSSSLQNFDGLLRWSPATSHLSLIWRTLIVLSIMLPLGLSVLYKRFTGGIGSQDLPDRVVHFAPTALPGLDHVGSLALLANYTVQFLDYTGYRDPPFDTGVEINKPFGHNLLLISNTSAAALDIPMPKVLSRLQQELTPEEAYYLKTFVRGTVVTYNSTSESYRDGLSFWKRFKPDGKNDLPLWWNNGDGTWFGMFTMNQAVSDAAGDWNCSWAFLGNFYPPKGTADAATDASTNPAAMRKAFQRSPYVHGFDLRRHNCSAIFRITRSSVVLERGSCSPDSLPFQYQYFENSEMMIGEQDGFSLQQTLGYAFDPAKLAFDPAKYGNLDLAWLIRPTSWLIPTYTVYTAALYQSKLAQAHGLVHTQPNGPIFHYWYSQPTLDVPDAPKLMMSMKYPVLNETYFLAGSKLRKEGPTLQPDVTLYLVVAALPLLTVVAYLVPFLLIRFNRGNDSSHGRSVAIPRGFNIAALLSGLDRNSLNVFSSQSGERHTNNVALIGKTKRKIILDLDKIPLDEVATRSSDESHHDSDSITDVEAPGCERKTPNSIRYVLREPTTSSSLRKKRLAKVASAAANTAAVSTMAMAFAG